MDLIIVGGGIIGMLTARYLAQDGCHVTLLERGRLGEESSWAGGGILSPLYPWRYEEPVTRLAKWSQQHYAELTDELVTETGVDPEYTRSGMLMLGVQPEELLSAKAWAGNSGYSFEVISSSELADIQHGLGCFDGYNLWMPEVAQVRNPRFVRALGRSIRRHGVVVHENSQVDKILIDDERVTGVQCGESRISAPTVVICSGSWSDLLIKTTGYSSGVYPVKGQILLYQAPQDHLKRIVLADNHYIIPRRDGHILVGSTMEYSGFDKSTTLEAKSELQAAAEQILPGLTRYPLVKQWAGLRPGRERGIPCISRHRQIQGLFVNAGQFRNGVVTGLASARLMADIVLRRDPILALEDFAL